MPRPSRIHEQRRRLLRLVAEAFGELGYRRATTAKLAKRCKVRENILYRLWKDKKEMFMASLESLFHRRRDELDKAIRESKGRGSRAEKMIAYASRHFGDHSLARVIFAGLAETDDPEIRKALSRMYRNYQEYLEREIRAHRRKDGPSTALDVQMSALAMVGLATALNVYREVGLIPSERYAAFFEQAISKIAPVLLEGSGQ